jgi:hypothetical protein
MVKQCIKLYIAVPAWRKCKRPDHPGFFAGEITQINGLGSASSVGADSKRLEEVAEDARAGSDFSRRELLVIKSRVKAASMGYLGSFKRRITLSNVGPYRGRGAG